MCDYDMNDTLNLQLQYPDMLKKIYEESDFSKFKELDDVYDYEKPEESEENKSGIEILDYYQSSNVIFDRYPNTKDWHIVGT